MGRYIRDIELQLPAEEVEREIQLFLDNADFYSAVWKEEKCFCTDYNSNGVPGRMKNLKEIYFFLFTYTGGVLHIEAWVRDGKNSETGLTGFYNWMMKQPYLELMIKLEKALIEKLPENSELRIKNQLHLQKLRKQNSKMSTGKQAVNILALLLILWAFWSCLTYLGFF